MIEVDFITLGDASERLNVSPSTLRHWTDQLEELDVHYTKRNNRNERIYYESDLRIFGFLRDLKSEHGRRTTMQDLANMLIDRANYDGYFQLRSKEDAPLPKQPSNKTADLLGQEDIKRLMQSERVREFMSIIVRETTKNLKEDLRKEITEEFNNTNRQLIESYENLKKELEKRDRLLEEKIAERDKKLIETLNLLQNQKQKGFFAKLFGK